MALADNIVLYYSFDDDDLTGTDPDDITGNGNDGTNVNNVPTGISGKINEAFQFGADDDYVTRTELSEVGKNEAYSINVWVFPDDGSVNTVFFQNNADSNDRNNMGIRSNEAVVGYFDGSTSRTTSKDITDSVWSMVTFTKTGTTVKVYVNGVLGSGAEDVSHPTSAGFYLGAGNNGGTISTEFNGDMDEIGIWSRVLSQEEIDELYNGGDGLQYPFAEPVAADDAVFFGHNF